MKELDKTKYYQVLSYPKGESEELVRRLKEVERLGVQALEFTGEKSIFGVPVLGKGCVGIVAIAYTQSERAALKIRRVDTDRKGMVHEVEMLKIANAVNVGPNLFKSSDNFILMELVEGSKFPEWLKSLEGIKVQSRVQLVLEGILEQCYRLDKAGLDHGELSNAPKHIIVDADDVPHLIDFETASINRRVSNVTSVCQYLFMGSQIADKVKTIHGNINEKDLVYALRKYKRHPTRNNFEKIKKTVMT